MTVATTITVTRFGWQDFTVEIEGRVSSYSSPNPNEDGQCVEDVRVISPAWVRLSQREHSRAVEQLEREWL